MVVPVGKTIYNIRYHETQSGDQKMADLSGTATLWWDQSLKKRWG